MSSSIVRDMLVDKSEVLASSDALQLSCTADLSSSPHTDVVIMHMNFVEAVRAAGT